MGNTNKILGSTENLVFQEYKNSGKDIDFEEYCEQKSEDIEMANSERFNLTATNEETGYWLLFSATVLWFILFLGLIYIYWKKYIHTPQVEYMKSKTRFYANGPSSYTL